MFHYTLLSALKDRRDILNERIAEQEAAEYYDAVQTVRAFVDEHGLTREEIYPAVEGEKACARVGRDTASNAPASVS